MATDSAKATSGVDMKDSIKTSGQVEIRVRGADGKTKHVEVHKNLVVTTGRNHIADQMAGQSQAAMSHMAIGSGTTAQAATDTALQTEISRKAFTSKDQGAGLDAHKVVYVAEWPAGDGTGAIAEAGIFNAAAAGVMLCRTVFSVKNKGASDSLTLTWTISFSG